ncbi:MAG: MscL family protein [Anaerolineae bacterium]|nr:MscL family protein [Anaerolineae bacterium]
MIQEFIKFIRNTNAIALAIGVIIAGATGKLIDAVVANVLNPIIGVFLGGMNLSNALIIPLGTTLNDKGEKVLNAIKLGDLISVFINFVLVMGVVFIIARKFAPSAVETK